MRKRYFIYSIILSVFFVIAGCKTSIDNSFRINNLAAAKVIVNFRAHAITVTSGVYTISATMTSSDNQATTTSP